MILRTTSCNYNSSTVVMVQLSMGVNIGMRYFDCHIVKYIDWAVHINKNNDDRHHDIMMTPKMNVYEGLSA